MFRELALVVVAFFIGAYTPKYAMATANLHAQMMEKAGRPNLTCQINCRYRWLSNFQKMITLHNSSQWEAPAKLVCRRNIKETFHK